MSVETESKHVQITVITTTKTITFNYYGNDELKLYNKIEDDKFSHQRSKQSQLATIRDLQKNWTY